MEQPRLRPHLVALAGKLWPEASGEIQQSRTRYVKNDFIANAT